MYSRRKDKIVLIMKNSIVESVCHLLREPQFLIFPLIAVKVKKVYIRKMKFKSDFKNYVFCLEMFVKDYEKAQANCK